MVRSLTSRPGVEAERRLKRRCASVLLVALALAGCGDGERVVPVQSTVDETATTLEGDPTAPSMVPETAPAPTSAPVPGPSATGLIELCRDVPVLTTDVIGERGSVVEVDPIFHGVLLTYAAEHPDTFAGMWIDREAFGTMVLAFTDDPASHRPALAARAPSPDDIAAVEPRPAITDDRPIGEWDIAFDVVQTRYSEADLTNLQADVMAVLYDLGVEPVGAGVLVMQNRVGLLVPEGMTFDEGADLAERVGVVAPLDAVCFEGAYLDERPEPVAPGTPLDVIVLPDADGTYPPDAEVECGGVQFTLGELASMTPVAEADDELEAVVQEWIDTAGFGESSDGWHVLVQTDDFATLVRITDGSMEFIGAKPGRNGWIWTGDSGGGGRCDVRRRLPPGIGQVDWALDPSFPTPNEASTELHVLVTEASCAGGSELGDRLLGPDIEVTAYAVRIVFGAIPLVGDQSCPSNPSTPVTIELDEPLGERSVMDGLLVGTLSDLVPD